jgi:hypothetical protein
MNTQALTETTQTLMRAVVNSGCIRQGNEGDVTLAVKVMREELKAFLDTENPKYADERALVTADATTRPRDDGHCCMHPSVNAGAGLFEPSRNGSR